MAARVPKVKAAEQPAGRPRYADGTAYRPGDAVTVKATGETGRALYATVRTIDDAPAWCLVVELDEARQDGRRSTTAPAVRFLPTHQHADANTVPAP